MLLGILSAVLLTVSLFVPAIDLSAYHAQVQIRYSIMKICENVGLISDMWRGIPIGILVAAVGMLVLSFVRIPPLKAIPCMIVVCMIIIALVDMGNVTAWISKMLARFISSQVSSGSSVCFTHIKYNLRLCLITVNYKLLAIHICHNNCIPVVVILIHCII